jgi:serine/threonine protein kinase
MLMGGVGVKCDIWSLGVILYYFVTGEFPFQGNSKEQVKNKILNH